MNYARLGQRIQQTRICKRVTQQQIAKQLNFSQQHIGNVERGIAHPSIDLLVDISNILNVSVDYLLQDSLKRKSAGTPAGILFDILESMEQQELEIQNLQKMFRKS